MIFDLKNKFNTFINSDKDYPLLVGFISGFYPFVFYYSNNFEMVNSWQHFLFFSFSFLLAPALLIKVLYGFFEKINWLNNFKKHFLFVCIIALTSVYLCFAYYQGFRRIILFGIFLLAIILSTKLYKEYKKIVVFVALLAIIPSFSLGFILLKHLNPNKLSWMKQEDAIESIKFASSPNVYFIEPDGYVGRKSMSKAPYSYDNKMYDWFTQNGFKLYDCNSNYPASLASNASLFAMKHHYLRSIPKSPFEMENAREIIVGNNPVISIFKRNNYKTFFIAEDEYFQHNFTSKYYDYYNISNSEIAFYTGQDLIKKDVLVDLKKCIISEKSNKQAKFFFVERLLPHHIHFDGTGIDHERKVYLKKIEEVNVWLQEAIAFIEQHDPNSVIIISADHGGWVGIQDLQEMFTTKDQKLLASLYNNLLAIKWNSKDFAEYDSNLKSNVNIFRVLFSYLSKDKSLLKKLEKDDSYRILNDGFGRKAEKVEW